MAWWFISNVLFTLICMMSHNHQIFVCFPVPNMHVDRFLWIF